MLGSAPDSEKIRLRELKAKRKALWRRFEENPNEIHLAAQLKVIDDQIAQPYLQRDRNANKIDNSGMAIAPDVGGLFLLLAVSPRIES